MSVFILKQVILTEEFTNRVFTIQKAFFLISYMAKQYVLCKT